MCMTQHSPHALKIDSKRSRNESWEMQLWKKVPMTTTHQETIRQRKRLEALISNTWVRANLLSTGCMNPDSSRPRKSMPRGAKPQRREMKYPQSVTASKVSMEVSQREQNKEGLEQEQKYRTLQSWLRLTEQNAFTLQRKTRQKGILRSHGTLHKSSNPRHLI